MTVVWYEIWGQEMNKWINIFIEIYKEATRAVF